MEKRAVEDLLGRIVLIGTVVTALIISPYVAIDVFSTSKMATLLVFAAVGIGVIVANRSVLTFLRFKLVIALVLAFCIWQFVVLFASGSNKFQQLFGISGRNTGLITYCGLAAIFLAAVFASNERFLEKCWKAFAVAGGFSIGYGLIQVFNMDPLPWAYIYSRIGGFFGNPDFQSAFVGLMASAVAAQVLNSKYSLEKKSGLVVSIFAGLLVAYKSQSQQGVLVFLIGAAVVVLIYIRTSHSKFFFFSYVGMLVLGFIAVALGSLNKGPLSGLLYKGSVANRGDYWRAAITMTKEHPIFGVGMDGYGDWYRRSRDSVAIGRSGVSTLADAAHNVFLDIAASGGAPLLIIYVVITGLVVVSLWKVIARAKTFDPYFASVASVWVGYQAQSAISINQIGLAVWGWVLSGTIIGYEMHTRDGNNADNLPKNKKQKVLEGTKISSKTKVAIAFSLVIGLILGTPPLMASARFKATTESDTVEEVIAGAYILPLSRDRMTLVGIVLRDNNVEVEALPILLRASREFPDSFETWEALASLTNATPAQVANANAQMKRLDPLNPTLK